MVKSKEKPKTVLERNKFYATTNVAGFGLIQSSNARIETAIWYIVILLFCGLTIRSIVILTNEYLNQEPIITVELETWNGSLPDIYIEMNILLPELHDEFDYLSYKRFPYSYNRSLSEDVNKVITDMDRKDKLIGPKVEWPYVLLPLVGRFTDMMQKLEVADFYYTNKTRIEEKLTKYTKNVYPYIRTFIAHCEQLEVTTTELIDEWFNQLKRMIFKNPAYWKMSRFGRAARMRAPGDDALELHGQLMNIHGLRIGFRLTNEIAAKSVHWIVTHREFVNILVNSGVLGDDYTTDQAVEWYTKKLKPTLYIYSNYIASRDTKPLMKIEFGQRIEKEVKMVYSFRYINRCNRTTPKWKCYTECMANFIMDKCRCIPRLFRANTMSTCTMEKYLSCGRNRYKYEEEEKHCLNSCFKHCNEDILSFDRVFERAQTKHGNDTLELVLQPTFTKHLVFQEFYAQSPTGFWADLGGAFDFWIGASVISAVHLIVYLTKQLIYAFKSGTKTGRNVRRIVRGFRSTGEDPAQMIASLTLGLTQTSLQNTEGQIYENSIDEKVETIENIIQRQTRKIENLEKEAQLQQHENKRKIENFEKDAQFQQEENNRKIENFEKDAQFQQEENNRKIENFEKDAQFQQEENNRKIENFEKEAKLERQENKQEIENLKQIIQRLLEKKEENS